MLPKPTFYQKTQAYESNSVVITHEEKIYKLGYSFTAPPVSTEYWTTAAWIYYINHWTWTLIEEEPEIQDLIELGHSPEDARNIVEENKS